MIFPTVHTNGTSREVLQTSYEIAYRALSNAIDTFSEAYPNGRDYYPQGQSALPAAMKEFEKHLSALKSAQQYCLEHFNYLDQ